MKILIALALFTFSTFASAEFCTAVIKDQYNGQEYENFTRSSYSRDDACYQAMYDCRGALSNAQSQGRYYNANCTVVVNTPPPPTQNLMCQTDLVDNWGRIIRQFTATGSSAYDACAQSDQFCKMELVRRNTYGTSCVNRGIINNGGRYPNPNPPVITAECSAARLDPAGNFVARYLGRAQGPQNTDVRGIACNNAFNACSRELVGRQTCIIER